MARTPTGGHVLGGDINGDGFSDAVISAMDLSIGAHYSGGVHVYAGSASGLLPEPVATFTVEQSLAFAGRALAMGDLNNDGLLDLAVGAHGYNIYPSFDYGRIDVYRGVAGQFFEAEPTWVLIGEFAGDNLGSSLGICDVDGDGIDDLVAGAYGAEDRSISPLRSAEGGAFVWKGAPQGLSESPAYSIYSGVAGLLLGRSMAVGQTDNDDNCEVALGSYTATFDGAGRDGVVALADDASITSGTGGFIRSYTIAEDDTSIEFGRSMALGDLDGDGKDDLIGGGWFSNGLGTSRGGAWVFLEKDVDHFPVGSLLTDADATAVVRSDSNFDYMGLGVAIHDGRAFLGAGSDEVVAGVSNAGAVWVFNGSDLVGEITTLRARQRWGGTDPSSFFGSAVGVVGDTNGDGQDEVVTFAARDDAVGVQGHVGYALSEYGSVDGLDMPSEPSGTGLGRKSSIGWVGNPSGGLDLLGGAWGQSTTTINTGEAFRWRLNGTWETSPSVTISGLPFQGGFDRLGVAVASAGDFAGTGTEHVVVVAYDEDQPNTFNAADFANPDDCPGTRNAAGAAWVFEGDEEWPSFVVFGVAVNDRWDVVDGGFDHNGTASTI